MPPGCNERVQYVANRFKAVEASRQPFSFWWFHFDRTSGRYRRVRGTDRDIIAGLGQIKGERYPRRLREQREAALYELADVL